MNFRTWQYQDFLSVDFERGRLRGHPQHCLWSFGFIGPCTHLIVKFEVIQTMPTRPNSRNQSTEIIAVAVRFLLPLIIAGVSIVSFIASCLVLQYVRHGLASDRLQQDFLVNVAAGLVEISIGTFVTALIAWAVVKIKFRQVARPVLSLIQRLRIDGKLTRDGARCSVVCAVAVLSESNVSKTIKAQPLGGRADCPICAKRVKERLDRCSYCQLPKTIWSDERLVTVHNNNPRKYLD